MSDAVNHLNEELGVGERSLFDGIPDPVFIHEDGSQRILMANRAALERYGYSLEELQGMTPIDLHPPEEHEQVHVRLDLPNPDKGNRYQHLTKNGRVMRVEITSDRIWLYDRAAWLSIVRDISDRLVEKSTLLAKLAGASQRVEHLESLCRVLGKRIGEELVELDPQSSIPLREMLEGGQDLIALELDELQLQMETLKPDLLLRAVAAECGGLDRLPTLQDLPLVLADRARLSRLFHLLLGDPALRTFEPTTHEENGRLHLALKIALNPSEELRPIGELLLLGLAGAFGGGMTNEERGKFLLELSFPIAPTLERGGDSPKILLVHAAPGRRTQITQTFEREGNTVVQAGSAQEALELLVVGKPWNLILVDLQLPDLDGESLGRSIRSQPAAEEAALWLLAPGDPSRHFGRATAAGFDGVRASLDSPEDLLGLLAGRPLPRGATRVEEGEAPSVLVVEDNLVNQKVVFHILRKLGFAVELAVNGQVGVDLASRRFFDAILMDCQMPVLDGYSATGAIRALPEPAGRVPIIALTANAMEGDREKCIAAGMDDYMSKPAKTDQLERMLLQWIPNCRERLENAKKDSLQPA